MSKKAKMEKQVAAKEKGRNKSAPGTAPTSASKSSTAADAPVAVNTKRSAVEQKHGLQERQIMLISKALADPTRLAIFRTIARGGASCGSIKDCIAVSAATLSHHMKELETAGLIETSREGRFMHAALQKKAWKSYLSELKSFTG